MPDSEDKTTQQIAQALSEVSERAQLLIREEIELAKVEMTTKVMALLKGAVIGGAAGVFVLVGLYFTLHGLAWLAWFELFPDQQFFWGFFVVAAALFLLGALAGLLAARLFKRGAPPKPTMAIEQAQAIRTTINAPESEHTH